MIKLSDLMESAFIVCLKKSTEETQRLAAMRKTTRMRATPNYSSVVVEGIPLTQETMPAAPRVCDCSCRSKEAARSRDQFFCFSGRTIEVIKQILNIESHEKCIPSLCISTITSFYVAHANPDISTLTCSYLRRWHWLVFFLGGGLFYWLHLVWCSVNGFLDWSTQSFQIVDIPDSSESFQLFKERLYRAPDSTYWSHTAGVADQSFLSWYWNVVNSLSHPLVLLIAPKMEGIGKALL